MYHKLTVRLPRSVAEDPRIAFQQSNLFWQVSCAKSKTKPLYRNQRLDYKLSPSILFDEATSFLQIHKLHDEDTGQCFTAQSQEQCMNFLVKLNASPPNRCL